MTDFCMERDSSEENEFNTVQEKIRRTKLDIMNKLQNLKTKRMLSRFQKGGEKA